MERNFTIKTTGSEGTFKSFTRKLFTLTSLFLMITTFSFAAGFEADFEIEVSSTDASCSGGNDGTATVITIDGWAPFTYEWSNGGNTPTITNLSPGLYEVTVIDADGAIRTGETYVGQNGGIQLNMAASYETCTGSSDANASVNASGGSGGYTYLWSNGETYVVNDNISAGIYTVTVTDDSGCTAVGSIEVELSPEGVWIMLSGEDAECGLDNGTAHVSVMTGVAPYTIVWSDGQMGEDATGLAPGVYSVTVTDANGCSNSEDIEIDSDGDLSISVSDTDAECGQDNGSATVSVNGGTAPITYQWSNGETTATITGLSAGTYSVTVSDGAGCSNVKTISIGQSGGIDVDVDHEDAACGQDNGSATATVNGGTAPFSYSWSNGANTASINGLSSGSYSVTVTDADGCNDSETFFIGSGTDIDVDLDGEDAECGQANGSATADVDGGTAPYTYNWSNGETTATITGISGGTYTVTVTDSAGCSDVESITIDQETEIDTDTNHTDASCNMNNGSATAYVNGGTPPYTFIWTTGSNSATITGLAPGIYTVTATDANGCTDAETVLVEGSDANGGTISTNDNLQVCSGDGNDDIVDLTLSGNFGDNSQWLVTNTNGDILGLSSGPSFNFENAGPGTCVIWHLSYQDGLTGLIPGNNVDDLQGCFNFSNSITVVRTEPDGGIISTNDNTIICVGDNSDDLINVNLTDATGSIQGWVITDQAGNILGLPTAPPFNFENAGTGTCLIWSISYEPGLSGLNMGANVGNLSGCYGFSNSIEVVRNETPTVTINSSNISCNGETDGSATAVAAGGDGNYTYLWSNGSTAASISNLGSGNYSVTVTDGNDCAIVSATVTITEPSLLAVSVNGTDETCTGSMDGTATAMVIGGTSPYSYDWSNGGTTSTISNLGAGTYTVTITDDNGCTAVSTVVTVESNGITSCSAAVTSSYNEGVDISTFGGSDGEATASATGGNLPLSYLWSNGQTSAIATNLSAGTYTVTVTDNNGCSCVSDVTLIDPAKVGNFVWEDLNKNGIQDPGEPGIGNVTVTLTGTATNGNSVTRTVNTNPDGSYIFDGLLPGNYKVTFANAAGYTTTSQNAGGDDSLDSDVDPATGMTAFFDLGQSECNVTIDAGFYRCVTIGDFVFYDGNRDGIQQPWEAGVPDVQVRLMAAGPDGVMCTADDVIVDAVYTGNDGRYLFECVEPGSYYIQFFPPGGGYMVTGQNQGGDDALDSDANPTDGKTPPFTVVDGMPDNLTYDAGIYLICDDFTTGGTIGYNQEICPGELPNTLINVSPPSGGYGAAEYIWLKSTSGGPVGGGSWMEIPGSDSPTYAPPQLYQTTYFIRCARREGCTEYVAESNVVAIVVNVCLGGLIQNLNLEIEAESNVAISWMTDPETQLFRYDVERSFDNVEFENIGNVNGLGNQQSMNYYDYMDPNPRIGRNIYRIVRVNIATQETYYSNTVEIMFNAENSKFFVYPNPTSSMLFIESIQNMNGNATLELYDATGRFLESILVDYTVGKAEFNFDQYASGPYFIKIIYADKDDTDVIRIIKK